MKPSEWLQKLMNDTEFRRFPVQTFSKSCLLYFKRDYGIFLIEDNTGRDVKHYTVKVQGYYKTGNALMFNNRELMIGLYIKKFASHIPNLLHVKEIFLGDNPNYYQLFTDEALKLANCKKGNIKEIYPIVYQDRTEYSYYLTEACNYNLNYYLGVGKGMLSYETFLGFTFGLLVGLQTLHRLGIMHRDIKAPNVLLCNSNIAKEYSNIKYIYDDGMKNRKTWTISYKILNNVDIKIIDFGESEVINDTSVNECKLFKNEISVAFVELLILMWRKVSDKTIERENSFQFLINILRNCSETVLEAMFSPVFDIFTKPLDTKSHTVNLLPF